LDAATAEAITEIFTEVVAAPSADDAAKAVFAKKKNLRLLLTGDLPDPKRSGLSIKPTTGGLLVQSRDNGHVADDAFTVVSKRRPSVQELADCHFAWTIAKHVKSNAIVFGTKDRTLGIGAGQMSRIDSCRIAVWKAQEAGLSLVGSAVASDAMFPFPDGLIAAATAGATAAIQPGGSVKDKEVIEAANTHNMAMVFTGHRHFLH
jgi:phosphoribosylaminoimidazolecarboxamide formyltransferase/IMP cyclohydrolase